MEELDCSMGEVMKTLAQPKLDSNTLLLKAAMERAPDKLRAGAYSPGNIGEWSWGSVTGGGCAGGALPRG